MKTSLIKNLILGTTLATGVVAMTWNGGATLQSAKQTISGYVSTIGIFKDNETKLVNKINSLNQEKALLETQLKEKDVNIQEVTSKLEEVNSQIAQYEERLVNAETQLDNANIEITKANNEAKELQAYIDTLVATPQPIDVTEIVGVLEDEPIVKPTPGTPIVVTWDGLSVYENEYIKVELLDNRELSGSMEMQITSINNDPSINPFQVKSNGLNTVTLAYSLPKSFGITGNEKIEIMSNNETLLVTINLDIK